MKHVCLFISCLLAGVVAQAQVPYVPAKNAVQLGADAIGIDPANGLKLRYSVEYRRYFRRDRLSLGLSAGFANSQRKTVLIPDLVSVGTNTRHRAMLDLTLAYNLLRGVHHGLRLGAGPSAWYGYDDLFVKVDPYPVPTGTQPLVERRVTSGWNAGAHATLEYTYALALNTQVSLQTGLVVMTPSAVIPLFGLRAGYRF